MVSYTEDVISFGFTKNNGEPIDIILSVIAALYPNVVYG